MHPLVSELRRLYLANGVTTVRFAGNDPDAVPAPGRHGPRASRAAVFSWGCSRRVFLTIPPCPWPLPGGGGPPAVQRLKADYRADGIILTQKPALEIARAAVDEAHRLGIGVTGQTWSLTAREAVALGYDGLENTSRLPEAPRALPEAGLLRYRTIPERGGAALLRARPTPGAEARHQMLKYGTYLVPTSPRWRRCWAGRRRASAGRRHAGCRPTPGVTSCAGSASASRGRVDTLRDFANWRGRPLPRFIRPDAAAGRACPNTEPLAMPGLPLPRGAPPAPGMRLSSAAAAGRDGRNAAGDAGRTSVGSRPAPGGSVLVAGNLAPPPGRRARRLGLVVLRGRLSRRAPLPRPRSRSA
jgi:hypothetical protein